MKLTDLKDLKVIKKDLQPQPEKKPAQEPPLKRSVKHPGREKPVPHEGLTIGQKVRMMDSNDMATLVAIGKGYYELEMDGLTFRAVRSEFIPVDLEDDRRLRRSVPSRGQQQAKEEPVVEEDSGDITVDLHIERIPGSEGIPEWASLEFQMDYFRQVLRKNLKHRGRRITFIHGVGEGTLAAAIRKELDEVFALSCTYTYGPMGATNVTIR